MKKYWLVRPKPYGISRINEFLSDKIIAIGWSSLGDLTDCSCEKIKDLLKQPPYSLESYEWGRAYATVDIFVNQMEVGDLVLVPNFDDIYFGRITGDYYFDPAQDSDTCGYPHQRAVTWLSRCRRDELSIELRSSLKARNTAAHLDKHAAEIEALANGERHETAPEKTETVSVSYPLRSDFAVTFEIPKNITKEEAQRLGAYFASLYFVS